MTKPKIENVSFADIVKCSYQNNPATTCLIQITDIDGNWPPVNDPFVMVTKFKFADLSNETEVNRSVMFDEDQAEQIHDILTYCLDFGYNVTVQCVAGLSRSGAIAEFGEIIGFEYIGRTRQPNVHVKSMLMKIAGLSYE